MEHKQIVTVSLSRGMGGWRSLLGKSMLDIDEKVGQRLNDGTEMALRASKLSHEIVRGLQEQAYAPADPVYKSQILSKPPDGFEVKGKRLVGHDRVQVKAKGVGSEAFDPTKPFEVRFEGKVSKSWKNKISQEVPEVNNYVQESTRKKRLLAAGQRNKYVNEEQAISKAFTKKKRVEKEQEKIQENRLRAENPAPSLV